MASVNRYLKDKAMDHIDHALGRPVDPMADTYRDYFAADAHGAKAEEFRASPNWVEGRTRDSLTYFFVTPTGRAALKEHLREIGELHREYLVLLDGEAFGPRAAKTHGAARYDAWLDVSDCWDISFGDFCKRSRVRLARAA